MLKYKLLITTLDESCQESSVEIGVFDSFEAAAKQAKELSKNKPEYRDDCWGMDSWVKSAHFMSWDSDFWWSPSENIDCLFEIHEF
jgi:hypothetical protein